MGPEGQMKTLLTALIGLACIVGHGFHPRR